ncbi:unnamed protein product (macronuclear) [Paramecium tetraurelia]|uniref:Transmembrane protein n=1 Tax=Paramecium tetraurelia TaxID=5888 RepID=A0C5A7_PARTE|nr:uncharacterized protein GSPATT00006473001 [Paramecium tetraurelia]CAK65974.1 unnamed protein product [Paramecium tetraurelia]|eukprot:XP_001433371.1 hypothetical protein (macronuclear) [Paramecium tetraurelia strain d4-2]
MIIIILLVIISEFQLCQSKIFEIKEQNGKLKIGTINGFEFELFLSLESQISKLNSIQISKCTQNCNDCAKRQCYLGNKELDHSEIKLYDLDTQQMVFQPLTYFNDQNQSLSISTVSLSNPGQYINSFVDEGFQLCQSNTDKTLETSFQMKLKDIPKQKVIVSPILQLNSYNYVQINYLKFGDTQIDISSCRVLFKFGPEQDMNTNTSDHYNLSKAQQKLTNIFENSDINHFPLWLFNIIYEQFQEAGFSYIDENNRIKLVKRQLNESTNVKLDLKYDFKFFNKENEEYPITYSSNQYLEEISEGEQWVKIAISNKSNSIILGSSFFQNKKMSFNFKKNYITIQNQFDEKCFQYEKSTLYQQEILVIWISIPLIILLTLFYFKYQINEEISQFKVEDNKEI